MSSKLLTSFGPSVHVFAETPARGRWEGQGLRPQAHTLGREVGAKPLPSVFM